MTLGISFASWISPYYFLLFGVKLGLILSAVINLMFLWMHLTFFGNYTVLFSYFLLGIFYQFVTNGNNLFISEKYTNGISYSKYFSSARLIFIVVLGYVY